MTTVTILHLTDLHFGWDSSDKNKHAERTVCLESLLTAIGTLESSWKPSVICVSGDIGWRGASDNYTEAKKWLNRLLKVCGIGYDRLIVSPGNHDAMRLEAIKNARPTEPDESDAVLGVPIAEHFLRPFTEFSKFCKKAGIKPLKLGDGESCLVGERMVDQLRFVTLNSAWFAKDEHDKGKLWLGLPHLKYLEAKGQLPLVYGDSPAPITIALMHHPPEWLQEQETHVWRTRQNSWDYLALRCHAVLTGHTHGEVRRADRIAEGAYHFTGGSAYAGAAHFNSFRLLQVNQDHIVYRSFEFDPRSPENKWSSSDARPLPLGKEIAGGTLQDHKIQEMSRAAELRAALKADAKRFIDSKSRILRPSGALPNSVPQQVSVRVSAQVDRFDSHGRLIQDKKSDQVMPLYEAIRTARRTLLLGDLGTGKSSLGASLVAETIDRSETTVAAIIPVKNLRISGQFTIHDLLHAADEYLSTQAAPTISKIELKTLLESKLEVLLVLDGLDELDRSLAARVLRQAASLPEHWPTIQVVTTGRPVELSGVAYSDWQVVKTVPLNDDMKRQFIKEELLADSVDPNLVNAEVTNLLTVLRGFPALDVLANAPLTIRLLTSRLRALSSSLVELTLGDLLYDLLLERLGLWQFRDDKPQKFDEFENAFPTPEAKSLYLGKLALKIVTDPRLTIDAAKILLQDAAPSDKKYNKYQLAEDALAYFELSGLISRTESIEFMIQPLAEMATAIGIATEWSSKEKGWQLPDSKHWRIVSFASSVIRRKGWLDKLRRPILSYIESMLTTPADLPAACYIAVETADEICAQKTVAFFSRLGHRPLTLFNEERNVSARNVAKTLWLAQDSGFEWFYNQYLNPRYPLPLPGVGIVENVFTHWTAIARNCLTVDQTHRLSALVQPFLATGEAQFFGVLSRLSLLVPESFMTEDRVWFQSELLDNSLLGHTAKNALMDTAKGGRHELVSRLLLHRAVDSASATLLWFDLNPQAEVSGTLIQSIFKSFAKASGTPDSEKLANLFHERVGNERWLWFARWELSGEDNVASCGAAIALYNAGERRLAVIGRVLMRAMHDGGYIVEAENILSSLVMQQGEKSVRWLASRMAETDEMLGGHSGWWRILLSKIVHLADGPSILANCIRSLGPFVLPRYPEIREAFTRLLKGSRGKEFREALFLQLHSSDPQTRRGAAVTLLTVDPHNEADALFVATRSRAGRRAHDWHEWEAFCLTLNFGPSVLAFLKSRLELLEPNSRAFALAILAKAKIPLESHLREELSCSLLSIGNWYLNAEGLGSLALDSEESVEILLSQLSRPRTELAERAATRLLELHRPRLTVEQEAKCIALVSRPSRWSVDLPRNMARIRQDAGFVNALEEACKEIVEQGGSQPLLQLVLKARNDSNLWKDVVWALLCDDSGIQGGSHEADDTGQALLEYGRDNPQDAEAIGKAAKECLTDERMYRNRWVDAYHWLVVIADEFGGLTPDVIRNALTTGRAIWYSAATALIARLGEVPKNFVHNRTTRQRPPDKKDHEQLARDQITEKLKDYSRDSDELHPNILRAIEECLFLSILPEETLSEYAATGNPGRLIATTLRYCYGQKPRLAETIPLMDIWGRLLRRGYEQKKQERRLRQIWMTVRATVVQENTEATADYLRALDSTLVEGEIWKLPVALEILRIRGSLLP